jgi:integrase
MAYAERVPSPRGDYWRGRYQDPAGRYLTVRDEEGNPLRFQRKNDAEKAADDKEAEVRAGDWIDPAAGEVLFGDWADQWWKDNQDLAESTIANRKRHLEDHLIPFFGETALVRIDKALIARWKREERRDGYAASSVSTWHGTLHTCLEDAVGVHVRVNAATRKRGRGRRSGSGNRASRGPEKVITSPFGVLLIAERMAILSGRDDEFAMVQDMFWNCLRLGELVGQRRADIAWAKAKVEEQLHEVEGALIACPPKDDSFGTLAMPPFLSLLLTEFTRDHPLPPCPCHRQIYVFRGMAEPRRARGTVPAKVIAAAAGVSPTTVSAVLYGASGTRVSQDMARRVRDAASAAGWQPLDGVARDVAWHWRRSSFEELFTGAASGMLPARKPLPRRPVPLDGEWPGRRLHGRAVSRASLQWEPVAEGMTPHGARHSCKSWMEEQGVPEVLSEQRMRHELPGVSGKYRHVTPPMVADLMAAMTAAHEDALDRRLELSLRSPVGALDAMLAERAAARKPKALPRDSPESAIRVLPTRATTLPDLRRGDWI